MVIAPKIREKISGVAREKGLSESEVVRAFILEGLENERKNA